MRRNRRQRGFSLIELLIVIAIIFTIAAIAVPNYMKAQMHAKELAAVEAIHTIHKVQVMYSSQYGRFAASLAELGPPASGAEGPSAAGLISSDLASGEKDQYKFTMQGTPGGYTVTAVPLVIRADSASFYSDQSMEVHENRGPGMASAGSPLLGKAAKAAGDTK
jgi:type IV pilus assembly protein PilA